MKLSALSLAKLVTPIKGPGVYLNGALRDMKREAVRGTLNSMNDFHRTTIHSVHPGRPGIIYNSFLVFSPHFPESSWLTSRATTSGMKLSCLDLNASLAGLERSRRRNIGLLNVRSNTWRMAASALQGVPSIMHGALSFLLTAWHWLPLGAYHTVQSLRCIRRRRSDSSNL